MSRDRAFAMTHRTPEATADRSSACARPRGQCAAKRRVGHFKVGHRPRAVGTLLLALIASASAVAAQQPKLTVQVPSGPWTVGDQIPVTLRVHLPPATRQATPRFPQWQERWGGAEVVSATEPQRQEIRGNGVEWSQRVTVAGFRPGRIPLPAREIVLPLETESLHLSSAADLHLVLRSVLPTDVPREELRPREPAPLHLLPLGSRFWWTLAVGLALLTAALATAWLRRPAPQAATAPAPPPDPRFELEAAFAGLAEEDDGLRFHAGLSRAMRRFLGRIVGFPALESTTREIRRRLLAYRLPGESVRAAGELLTECDGVKFARRTPRAARRQLLAAARELADRVEDHATRLREAERHAAMAAGESEEAA